VANLYGILGGASAAGAGAQGAQLLERIMEARRQQDLLERHLGLQELVGRTNVGTTLLNAGNVQGAQQYLPPGTYTPHYQQQQLLKQTPEAPKTLEEALTQLMTRGPRPDQSQGSLLPGDRSAPTQTAGPSDQDVQRITDAYIQMKRVPQTYDEAMKGHLYNKVLSMPPGGKLTDLEQQLFEHHVLGIKENEPVKRVIAPIVQKQASGQTLTPGEKDIYDAWKLSLTGENKAFPSLLTGMAAMLNAQTAQQRAGVQAAHETRESFAQRAGRIGQEVQKITGQHSKFADIPGKLGEEARTRDTQKHIADIGALYDREIALEPDENMKNVLKLLKTEEIKKRRAGMGAAGFFGDLTGAQPR